jgi:hypothetical protein
MMMMMQDQGLRKHRQQHTTLAWAQMSMSDSCRFGKIDSNNMCRPQR